MNSLSCIYYHSPIPFLVLHRVWAGEGNFEKQSPVPFLVLHRVWAGEGNFEKQSPVPFLVSHRVRAGEGCGFLREMTIEQVWHFQPQSIPVPFLVLHRVRAGAGCRVAHMLVNLTQSLSCCLPVTLASDVLQRALLTFLSSPPVSSPWFVASKLEGSRASAW